MMRPLRGLALLSLLAAACLGWRHGGRELDGVKLLPTEGLSSSLQGASDDTVVYFYAPWCPNCAQFDRIWTALAEARARRRGERRASMSKFDCESSVEATRLCNEAGVDRYPAVIYFGQESFGRRRGGREQHAVIYPGELYAEAINSWIGVLEGASWWKSVTGWARDWGTRRRRRRRAQGQEPRQETLTQSAPPTPQETVPQPVSAHSDAFLALGDVEPDFQLALQTCVADLSLEYCKGVEKAGGQEPYCAMVEDCYRQGFHPEECRPAAGCPFAEGGCDTVNLCVNPSVLLQYQHLLQQEGLVAS